jgi:hypothetical protein
MILTGMAVAGVSTTTYLAVKNTPRAYMDIQHAESERVEPLTNVEKVKLTYHYYIPAAVAGSLTIGAIVMAHSVNSRRQAAFISAYTLVETKLRDYQEKVVENIGVKKEQTIREDVARENVKNNPVANASVIVTNTGEQMFLDITSGRHFKSTVDRVRKAENQLNFELNNNAYASLNDFYEYLHIPHISMGEELGWKSDNLVEIKLDTILDEDTAVITIDFSVVPIRDYYKFR